MSNKLDGNVKLTLHIDLKKITHQQELALRIFLLLNQSGKQEAAELLKELQKTFILPMLGAEEKKK